MEQLVKLDRFKNAVFAEIEAKSAQIRDEGAKEKQTLIQKHKQEYEKLAKQEIETQANELKSKLKRDTARAELDAHRAILAKRREITQQVFDNVAKKLSAYCETAEYEDYLKTMLEDFKASQQYQEIDLLLCPRDMKYADLAKKIFGKACTVKENAEIKIGGFIVVDKADSRYFDETLEQKLSEQHSYFIENSGLNL